MIFHSLCHPSKPRGFGSSPFRGSSNKKA